jgi:hypothetical protein
MKTIFRNYKQIVLLPVMLLMISSCELTNDLLGTNETIAELEGEWACAETSELFKKMLTPTSNYNVYISADADNENGIIIDGFYNLGDVGAKANVLGSTITMPEQTLEGGYTVLSGSGSVSSNKEVITWYFEINVGGDVCPEQSSIAR